MTLTPPASNTVKVLETTLYDAEADEYLLLDRHIARLHRSFGELHSYYGSTENAFHPSAMPSAQDVTNTIKSRVQEVMKATSGEGHVRYRVRILVDSNGGIEVQVAPQKQMAPISLALNDVSGETLLAASKKIIVLDRQSTPAHEGDKAVMDVFIRNKTSHRDHYNQARTRAGCVDLFNPQPAAEGEKERPDDVILYNPNEQVTETSIANIAIQMPVSNKADGHLEWVTPALECGLLDGTVRQELIKNGSVVEGVITIRDIKEAAQDGRGVCCFNSLRGVYPVTIELS
ncbi:hypothetical protein GQ42DRAFT_144073 [Ramicandelaber brevisporus]|nr:hypothetical protein GQ42DRAFT_144073 [Ramicandelaber brevisporus]